MSKKEFTPNKLRPWVEARKKYHLSHAQIQMAREIGLNPKKFGSLANHKQEIWKATLPEYIGHLYEKRFKKTQPGDVRSIEIKLKEKSKRKETKKTEGLSTEKVSGIVICRPRAQCND